MGKRLYVAKKYDVEWSDEPACFNWKQEEFHYLMSILEVDAGEPYDDYFSISVDAWKEGIERLKDYDNLELYTQQEIDEVLKKLEYSRDEIIEIMNKYLNKADSNDGYLYFSFW